MQARVFKRLRYVNLRIQNHISSLKRIRSGFLGCSFLRDISKKVTFTDLSIARKGCFWIKKLEMKVVEFRIEIRQNFLKVKVIIFQGISKVEVVDSRFPGISQTGIDSRVSCKSGLKICWSISKKSSLSQWGWKQKSSTFPWHWKFLDPRSCSTNLTLLCILLLDDN